MINCYYNAIITMQEYNQIFKYNDVDVLTLNIKYPIIRMNFNLCAEWNINRHISMLVNDYIRYSAYLYEQAVKNYNDSLENDFPFHSYEAYMEFVTTYNENCFLSMYFDKYEFTGGAHGSTIRSSVTWNLYGGMIIPLNSLFSPGTNYKFLLTNQAIKQAEENLAQNPGIYFEDYRMLMLKNFNDNSFYLTPDGLTIYYQQYDIAPYSTGIVEFTIPYRVIRWYPTC